MAFLHSETAFLHSETAFLHSEKTFLHFERSFLQWRAPVLPSSNAELVSKIALPTQNHVSSTFQLVDIHILPKASISNYPDANSMQSSLQDDVVDLVWDHDIYVDWPAVEDEYYRCRHQTVVREILSIAGYLHSRGFIVHCDPGTSGLVALLKSPGMRRDRVGRVVMLHAELGNPLGDDGNTTETACGYDTQIASLLGAADLLVSAHAALAWSGTLAIVVHQPMEDGGPEGIIEAGLLSSLRLVGVPTVIFGQHVERGHDGSVMIKDLHTYTPLPTSFDPPLRPPMWEPSIELTDVTLRPIFTHFFLPEDCLVSTHDFHNTCSRGLAEIAGAVGRNHVKYVVWGLGQEGSLSNITDERSSIKTGVRALSLAALGIWLDPYWTEN